MRSLLPIALVLLISGCTGFRTYTRSTPAPVEHAFACAAYQLEQLGYTVELRDSVGGVVQGQRQITGLTESARRGAAAATEVLTVGMAGSNRIRFDQLTIMVYSRPFPEGNAIDVTAGLLTVEGDDYEQSAPTRTARRDARRLVDSCAAI